MTESQALAVLHAMPRFAGASSLLPIRELLHVLGDPQDALRFVHVAGTNGKGSTATMIASVLKEAGLKVGLYTSPYINHFRERFLIDGTPVAIPPFLSATKKVLAAKKRMQSADRLAQFDAVTAIGFLIFAEEKCDVVVLECGLGGRLDATNVIKPPLLSVICNIGFDHTEILGKTAEAIASEKAGILKKGTGYAVFSPQDYPEARFVLEGKAKEEGIPYDAVSLSDISLEKATLSSLWFSYKGETFASRLSAPYQAKNGACAIAACRALAEMGLPITEKSLRDGLLHAFIPARLELFSLAPRVLLDGAHNKDGIRALKNSMEILCPQYAHLYVLLGMLKDKNPQDALSSFFASPDIKEKLVSVTCLTPDTPRAMDKNDLMALLKEKNLTAVPVFAPDDLQAAAVDLLSHMEKDDVLLAFGSLYAMGPLRRDLPAWLLQAEKERDNV